MPPYVYPKAKDNAQSEEFILHAYLNGSGEPLFLKCIHEVLEAPSSAKVKALSEVFLTKGAQMELNVGSQDKFKLLPENKEFQGDLMRLTAVLDHLAKAKTDGERLAVIDLVIQNTFTVPPTKVFDGFRTKAMTDSDAPWQFYNSKDFAAGKDTKTVQIVKDFRAGKLTDSQKSFAKNLEPDRMKLEKAGFDVKKLKK